MRRLRAIVAALFFSIAAFAYEPAIRDISISVDLQRDGSARFTEVWDITATEGTEWYLVRNNLGDIEVGDLSVSDESGRSYFCEKEWDINRSLSQKAGRCGLHHSDYGVEICWGLGSYGDHVYTVKYTMTNVVKSLEDADMLHLQLVSPGLSSRPRHVSVRIGAVPEGTRFWGFGFVGNSSLEGNEVVLESSEEFSRNSSVIALLRFPKGFFDSPSVRNGNFEEVLATALEGAEFDDERKESLLEKIIIGFFQAIPILAIIGAVGYGAGRKRRILGCKPSEVQWNRDVPYGGNLEESNYTLRNLGEAGKKGNSYASALILRMIYDGAIGVFKTNGNTVELSFNDAKAASLDSNAKGLYDMMKEASGGDEILQDREFSRWARRNYNTVNKWISGSVEAGAAALRASGQLAGSKYTKAGQEEARKLLGFKKFLSDFTLVKERATREVGLWQDYLVFASIFGIADKVAKELHDIDPKFFEEAVSQDFNTMNWLLWQNVNLSNAITNAQARAADAMSRSSGSFGGFGGGTSFGGGGGFSGGGFGGGAR